MVAFGGEKDIAESGYGGPKAPPLMDSGRLCLLLLNLLSNSSNIRLRQNRETTVKEVAFSNFVFIVGRQRDWQKRSGISYSG